jgi:tetratricopeptide (TPR) repeat protein
MSLLVISEKAERPITEDFLQYLPIEGEYMVKRSFLQSILLFFLILISITGCAGQVSQMSLEEAKQVAVSTSSVSGFVPPPRRIDDITAILNQPGTFDAKLVENYRAKAVETPPANAGINFYMERGLAAAAIGRSQQALEDYREALRLVERGDSHVEVYKVYTRLPAFERHIGNFGRALQLAEQGVRSFPQIPSTY